jgi:hypothetical protein
VRTALLTLTAAALFALASLLAHASTPTAQRESQPRPELFTPVEIRGWDFSYYDDRVRRAVIKASAPRAGRSLRRRAAAALLERANFFLDQGMPAFYKYALGDYRHVLRFRPGNAEAKERSEEIVSIYEKLGRPVPQNGNVEDEGVYLVEFYRTTPEPLDLEPGKGYTLRGHTAGRAAFVYEFAARAGQRLSVAVAPRGRKGEGRAAAPVFDLSFVERNGARNPYDSGSVGRQYKVLTTARHQIRVYSKGGETVYELKVRLDDSSLPAHARSTSRFMRPASMSATIL